MGGMVGQIDYAAGNEALARLGFWARDNLALPVQTLCWPTWERLGVIANYSAAVRYVSTLDPVEGARRWAEELASGHTDEAVFLGRIGAVLAPGQLRGFGMLTGHPDLPRLHALDHHLGEVEEYEIFRSLRTTLRLNAGQHPCPVGRTRRRGPRRPRQRRAGARGGRGRLGGAGRLGPCCICASCAS